MNYQLRPYQQELLDKTIKGFKEVNSILLQLPTGGGKTVLVSHYAKKCLQAGSSCLFLAHREELIFQAADKLKAITRQKLGIIKAGHEAHYTRTLQIASVQSMVRRLEDYPVFDTIIIDECHHVTSKTYKSILDYYPNAKVLGVSATPVRLDKIGLNNSFSQMIVGITTRELINIGALSSYKYFATEVVMSVEGASRTGGDYNPNNVARMNPVEGLTGDLIKSYRDYLANKQALVFCVNVEHSVAIAAHFNAVGIKSAHLDGSSAKEERTQIMTGFRSKQIKVLTNCSLYDEGLDIPGLDGVILARPTASLGRYLQMVGRALRPCKGKNNAIVIDLADNWIRHGLPCGDRQWSLDGTIVPDHNPNKQIERQLTGEVIEIEIDLREIGLKFMQVNEINNSDLFVWFKLASYAYSQGTLGDELIYSLLRAKDYRLPQIEVWKYLTQRAGVNNAESLKIYKFIENEIKTIEVISRGHNDNPEKKKTLGSLDLIWDILLEQANDVCRAKFYCFSKLTSIEMVNSCTAKVTITIKHEFLFRRVTVHILELKSLFSRFLDTKTIDICLVVGSIANPDIY